MARVKTVPYGIPREEAVEIYREIQRQKIPIVNFIKKHDPMHLSDVIREIRKVNPPWSKEYTDRELRSDIWSMVPQWDVGGPFPLDFDKDMRLIVNPDYKDDWLGG